MRLLDIIDRFLFGVVALGLEPVDYKEQLQAQEVINKNQAQTILDKNQEILKLNDKYEVLLTKYNAATQKQSLEDYGKWFKANIPRVRKYYTFRDNKSRPAHLHLEHFSKQEEWVCIFEEFLVKEFKLNQKKYTDPDKLVYEVSVFCHKWVEGFREGKEYRTDKAVFGENEHWASVAEVIQFYIEKKEAGDCDDTGTFISYCITTAMIYYELWDEHAWRLKHFTFDMLTGFGHYALGWLKFKENTGVIGWVPIESTFYPEKFREVWNNNLRIKDNILYSVRFSFDELAEYELIGKR